MNVFMLYHIRTNESGEQDEKLIGIYTTTEKAEAAIRRLEDRPGFRDYPAGFQIFEHMLDEDGWLEGFTTTDA